MANKNFMKNLTKNTQVRLKISSRRVRSSAMHDENV